MLTVVRIYLNTSALNRPFDDLSVPRVRAEAVAVVALFARIESRRIVLVSSEYLEFEAAQNPDPERAARIATLLESASAHVKVSSSVAARARDLERVGLRGLDALHVAAAEAGRVDLLVTTDDRMMKRVRRIDPPSSVRAASPGEALNALNEEKDQ
jgi:predicted nucleic acid-binding protein